MTSRGRANRRLPVGRAPIVRDLEATGFPLCHPCVLCGYGFESLPHRTQEVTQRNCVEARCTCDSAARESPLPAHSARQLQSRHLTEFSIRDLNQVFTKVFAEDFRKIKKNCASMPNCSFSLIFCTLQRSRQPCGVCSAETKLSNPM